MNQYPPPPEGPYQQNPPPQQFGQPQYPAPGQYPVPGQYPQPDYPPPPQYTTPQFPPPPGFPGRAPGPFSGLSRIQIVIGSVAGAVLLLIGVVIGNAAAGGQPQAAPTATVTVSAGAGAGSPQGGQSQGTTGGVGGVLYSFSGSSDKNSPPFVVNDSAVTVKYTFDCSAFGMKGNFIAHLDGGNPSAAFSDSNSIANDLSMGGTTTTTIYPRDRGFRYHLEVISECNWSMTLTNG